MLMRNCNNGLLQQGSEKACISTDAKIKHGAVFNQTIASSQFICSSNRNRVQRRKGTVASTYGTWIRSSCSSDSTHSCHQYLKKQNATWMITTATARCIIQTELKQRKTHPGKKWESFPLVCKREDGNVLPEPTPNSASSIILLHCFHNALPHLKALVFLYAFEESIDCLLLSSFCDDSNLHISLFKYVLSTMGVSKESISKFLIWNRYYVKLCILSPEICKQSLRVKSWKAEVTAEKKQTQNFNQNFVTQLINHNFLTNWLTSRILVATKQTETHEISVYSKFKRRLLK